jgi:hypothetical protein
MPASPHPFSYTKPQGREKEVRPQATEKTLFAADETLIEKQGQKLLTTEDTKEHKGNLN